MFTANGITIWQLHRERFSELSEELFVNHLNMPVGELRLEVLQWLNATLNLEYKKVEECGTGAAFCQLMDCIFGNVPMARVRFGKLTEYDSTYNWKILQAQFTRHKITKVIEVDRLVKCRLQDNLDLLQWFKRFWHEHGQISDYDPRARRRVVSASSAKSLSAGSAPVTPLVPKMRQVLSSSLRTTPGGGATQSRSTSGIFPPQASRVLSSGRQSPNSSQSLDLRAKSLADQLKSLQQYTISLLAELEDQKQKHYTASAELEEYKIHAQGLQAEKNFYFNKLREIEQLIDYTINEVNLSGNQGDLPSVVPILSQILSIAYRTEEGFESHSGVDDMEVSMREQGAGSNDLF